MPWFSETSIVYEVKSIGKNTYIEILGTQVKVSVATNPFLDIVWVQQESVLSLEDILRDPNQSDSSKIDVSEFTMKEIELQWDIIVATICEHEWLDIRTKTYFKKNTWWYHQLNINNER